MISLIIAIGVFDVCKILQTFFVFSAVFLIVFRFKNGRESTISLRDVALVLGRGSSNQSWHETIPPETVEVIHYGSSPSENASTHHEHDTLSCELPDEKDKPLGRKSNGDTPKASNVKIPIKLF